MDITTLLHLIPTLNEIGLNSKEAVVYLTLFSIGANPASILAKKTKINRCTCYAILNQLMQKGFIQQYIKENVTYYIASPPKCIINQLQNKQSELEDKINILSNSIAQFEIAKKENNGKHRVVFYEGEAGVKNIMEDTLTSKTIIRAYASLTELTALFPNYWPNYYRRRTEKGIFVKTIYPANEMSFLHKLRDKEELRESRLIPKEFDFHMDILIYDDKVAITSLREKFGVLIESKDMAESQRGLFDLIYDYTKTYDGIMTKNMEDIINKKGASLAQGPSLNLS
jgi:sugar-specific transcriptional regulator TrmB